jgi:hypothetical protein
MVVPSACAEGNTVQVCLYIITLDGVAIAVGPGTRTKTCCRSATVRVRASSTSSAVELRAPGSVRETDPFDAGDALHLSDRFEYLGCLLTVATADMKDEFEGLAS